MTAQEKFSKLVEWIRQYNDIAVAFSGGTKSSLLVCAAQEAAGNDIWVLTANTPFFTKEELYRVHEVLDEYRVRSERVSIPQLLMLDGIQQVETRCPSCAELISERLAEVAKGIGANVLLDGKTTDQQSSECSLLKSNASISAVSPFVELGYTKKDVGDMLDAIGRAYYKKTSNSCLACRFLDDEEITVSKLNFLEEAEKYIRRYTRNALNVCLHKGSALVYSCDELGLNKQKDIKQKLLELGKETRLDTVEFLNMPQS